METATRWVHKEVEDRLARLKMRSTGSPPNYLTLDPGGFGIGSDSRLLGRENALAEANQE